MTYNITTAPLLTRCDGYRKYFGHIFEHSRRKQGCGSHPYVDRRKQTNTFVSLTADGSDDLEGHVSDLLHTEGQEVVLLQDLRGAESQQLKDDADVAAVLEPVQHPHTGAGKRQRTAVRQERATRDSKFFKPTIQDSL